MNSTLLKVAVSNELMLENQIPRDPSLSRIVKDPSVVKFITLSKKLLNKELTPQEKKEYPNLLKDPKVQAYIQASKKVGQRIGWIKGGISGTVIGGLASTGPSAALGATGIGLAALALLGAIAGGLSVGYLASKIYGILRKWKTEEELTKGGLDSGALVRL
jgi:hypothetical protein